MIGIFKKNHSLVVSMSKCSEKETDELKLIILFVDFIFYGKKTSIFAFLFQFDKNDKTLFFN